MPKYMFVVSSSQSVECKKGKKWWQTDTKSLHCQPGTTPPKIHFRTPTLNTNTYFWSHERNTTKDTGKIHFLDRKIQSLSIANQAPPHQKFTSAKQPSSYPLLSKHNHFVKGKYFYCWLSFLLVVGYITIYVTWREPESRENRDFKSKMQDFRREVRIQLVFAVLSPRPSVL